MCSTNNPFIFKRSHNVFYKRETIIAEGIVMFHLFSLVDLTFPEVARLQKASSCASGNNNIKVYQIL